MNNSLDGSNLVNLSGDLSTLNQLETKETLALSFPFDHIYACHSEDSGRRQEQLAKEVEISLQPDVKELGATGEPTTEALDLTERLTAAEIQNTRLRHLLVYHLDLIQQQNDLITKKEKQNTALQLENDCLKSKVTRMDRRITVSQRHNINPAPVINAPPPNVPPPIVPPPIVSTPVKTESSTSDGQVVFNSLTDFLVPESRSNPYILNNEVAKTKPLTLDPFDLNRPSETDVTSYLPGNIGVPSILENSSLQSDNLSTMIENKRSYVKKDTKPEPRSEPLYTVTSNSGNTVIQKIQRTRRRTSGGLGSLSRLPKTPVPKTEPSDNVNMFEDDKAFERTFSVNKKSKMINTYGKSKTSTIPKKTPHYTGSLSDRLQLIDTTPTGEDPYQLGEADMREQSPIPKLMLQKTNHGRLKICSDLMGESTMPSRRIYDAPATETSTKMPNKIKLEKRYNLPTIVPYSVTHTSTHTSNKSTDSCTHLSTYTHVPKSAFTPKQTATLTPKQTSTLTSKQTSTLTTPKHTSTLTSTNACTHMSTYTHTTRNTTARTATASQKSTNKATKSPQSGSRKSTHAGSNKTTQKASNKTPLRTPHTSSLMATLTPLHVVPLLTTRPATHTATHGSLHAALLATPALVASSSSTRASLHAALITTPALVASSSATHGSLALITTPTLLSPRSATHGSLHAALTTKPTPVASSSATHGSLHAAVTTTPSPVTTSSAIYASLHAVVTATSTLVTPTLATHGSLHAAVTTTPTPVTLSSAIHKSLHAALTNTPMQVTPSSATYGTLLAALTSTPTPVTQSSATYGSLHAALTTTQTPVTQRSVTNTITEIKTEAPDSPMSPPNPFIPQQDVDCVKKEEPDPEPERDDDSPEMEWTFTYSTGNETSLCDFSYGENSNVTVLPALDVAEFRKLIESEVAAHGPIESPESLEYSVLENVEDDNIKKEGARTASSTAAPGEEIADNRRGMGSKRGRKRALSTAGLIKNAKQNLSKPVGPKPKMVKGKAACRGKKSPLPGMMTNKPYHTLVGDPDLSWYHGLDPDVKIEDIDQGDCKASTVEVPRWREKPYTCVYSLEGTENLDDKVFEKRHQKLEAEERRQLRWHMRRIREQRHVERLRMRQRDPWYSHSRYQPSVYTIWPQPQRDVRMIEITDTIPVMAFGEDLPDIPPADFMLPWVRTSKPLKRSKRSKTLH